MADQNDLPNPNPFEDENDLSLGQWIKEFIHHYWPVMFFASLFLIMMAFGLVIMSGQAALAIAGLMIIAVFGVAINLAFLAPVLLAPLLLLVALAIFLIYPETSYSSPTAPLLGVGIFGLFIAGTVYFLNKIRAKDKDDDVQPVAVASVATTTVEEEPEEEAVEVKGPKPVAFDLGIASKGVTIIFGTESGNAEGLAEVAKAGLESDGHPVQVLDAGVVDYRHFKAFANLLVITSTWGEGDPPSNAIDLVGDMKNDSLEHNNKGIQFSVLSLGDTSYELFCQCGKDFDAYLEKAGGKRVYQRVDCDVDYEQPFEEWLTGVRGALKGNLATVAEYTDEAPATEAA
jgi:flavodoxin